MFKNQDQLIEFIKNLRKDLLDRVNPSYDRLNELVYKKAVCDSFDYILSKLVFEMNNNTNKEG